MKLLNYRIETDHTVLLQYADGADKRVPISKLRKYVEQEDFNKIELALNLRKYYFKRNLPRLGVLAVVAGVVAFGGVSENQRLQRIIHHNALPIASPHVDSAKKAPLPSPKPAPVIVVTPTAHTPQPTPSSSASPSPSVTPASKSHKSKKQSIMDRIFHIHKPDKVK